MARPVFQYELDGSFRKSFKSVRSAAKEIGGDHRRICERIRKNRIYKDSYFDYVKLGNYFDKPAGQKNPAKILVFDIETSPMLSYTWGTFKQNIAPVQIKEDWKVLTWAAKWLGIDEIMSDAIIKHNKELDDFEVVASMWKLLNEADMVIAHNGKRFDVKKMNTRFLFHGMTPPSPYKVIDTLHIARANFAMSSNKLEYITKFLGQEGKLQHEGFELWTKCMANDEQAWANMLEYNEKDVTELEDVYMQLRAWDTRHPSVAIFNKDTTASCTTCGSTNLNYIKDVYTNTRAYKLYQCGDCDSWSRSRTGVNKKALLMPQ